MANVVVKREEIAASNYCGLQLSLPSATLYDM